MKTTAIHHKCWRWLLPALAYICVSPVMGQGILYFHQPVSNPDGDPDHLPWDSLGTQVGPDLPIVINGQTVFTFTSPIVAGQSSAFNIRPSSLSAVVAIQPNVINNPFDPTTFPIPLSTGQQIGPDAAGYNWLGNYLGGDILTCARDGGIIGEPPLTSGYFTGLESAYLGFLFVQNYQTYYGWIRLGCPVVGINVGWVYDYAYSTTPNTPILAGAIPEPSTAALLALGSLTFFIRRNAFAHRLTFRRRRAISSSGEFRLGDNQLDKCRRNH